MDIRLMVLTLFLPYLCDGAKINTPRVLLPWFENTYVNFTFEIHDGGCYVWSLSRDDIIELQPLYDSSWAQCSRAAKVTPAKTCVPPGTVIILAEEASSGEILRGDVDIDKITSLKITTTTSKLYLEEAPEAFEVTAFDSQGNTFSTLEGVDFTWKVQNIGENADENSIVTLVWWRDTDYEAPPGIAEIEAKGLRSYSTLLYGQAMGEVKVTACLGDICDHVSVNVVASVVLVPATAVIAPGDTVRYRVVRAKAGRLTVQNIADTLYKLQLPDETIASLEDSISLVKGNEIGTTSVHLYSGYVQVASATLSVSEPHSIKVNIKPNLLVKGEKFTIYTNVMDAEGRHLTAGDEMLVRLAVEGDANVELIRSTENGTVTEAYAHDEGTVTIIAKLHSVGGRTLTKKVEGTTTADVIKPLQVNPPELFIAWTDSIIETQLSHIGGGDYPVTWSTQDNDQETRNIQVTADGVVKAEGVGQIGVTVRLRDYPHVQASGRVWVLVPEILRVASSGQARVGKPHFLHIGLTVTHPNTRELINVHRCDCDTLSVNVLELPEPFNITAAPWIQPMDGACGVLSAIWRERGLSSLRISRGRAGDTARVVVRASPQLVWPQRAALLTSSTLPVLAEGEDLIPYSKDPKIAELTPRAESPPHRHPNYELFTIKCRRKGDTVLELRSKTEDGIESVSLEVACASLAEKIRLEPPPPPGNCSGAKLWIRAGDTAALKVQLLDVVGRELLDEKSHRVSWELNPSHSAIEFSSPDKLLIQTHPEYVPVPVPVRYYQIVQAGHAAAGWVGTIKAKAPDALATIQARVVAPLKSEPSKVYLAWEGEVKTYISTITGGSGNYAVQSSKDVAAELSGSRLAAVYTGPGSYDLIVTDMCVDKERIVIDVQVEEIITVEVSTTRALCVDSCATISALVRGLSDQFLTTASAPEFTSRGAIELKAGKICGIREGVGRVKAGVGGVWSAEVEVVVFPPLSMLPEKARLPPGARLQLKHKGGPPPHLASLHYEVVDGQNYIEVTQAGALHAVSVGSGRVRLTAKDVTGKNMAHAESDIEVIAITGIRARSATNTLLVGEPSSLWLEADGSLGPAILSALQPIPRVTWTVRDPSSARLYSTIVDDLLERSSAEGLSVRVVPLKPGLITIDVRVRNIAQISEARSWDSSIEILGISDLKVGVEGYAEIPRTERVAIAVGSHIKLKSMPRGTWKYISEDESFEVSPNGDVKAIKPGYGTAIVQHTDERNNIFRSTLIQIEVSKPHYITAERPESQDEEYSIRLAVRSTFGRRLLAPNTSLAVQHSRVYGTQRLSHLSTLGNELILSGLDSSGAFLTVDGTINGQILEDHIWVEGSDVEKEGITAAAGWAICLEGGFWHAPPTVTLVEGGMVTVAILNKEGGGRHVLKADRPPRSKIINQLPLSKMEFIPGDWPYSMVPLALESSSISGGPLLCTDEERRSLNDLDVPLPFVCRTEAPHIAKPILDVKSGKMGCSITPQTKITDLSEVEVCAEWGLAHSCTRVVLLPPVHVTQSRITLKKEPGLISVYGHPQALRTVTAIGTPGIKAEKKQKNDGEILIVVNTDQTTCGSGWVTIRSRLTSQEIRVPVQKECDVACGSLLGALFTFILPFIPSILVAAFVVAVSLYIYAKKFSKNVPIQFIPKSNFIGIEGHYSR